MVSARNLRSDHKDVGELIIDHEVAHQWFYALVGSDQINAPWLDEALVEFLAFRCYAERNGQAAADALWQERFETYPATQRTTRLDDDLYTITGKNEYFITVYAHGAALYRALWQELGDEAFFGALRIYFDANSFKQADFGKLIAAFEEATGRDLSQWFYEHMGPDCMLTFE